MWVESILTDIHVDNATAFDKFEWQQSPAMLAQHAI